MPFRSFPLRTSARLLVSALAIAGTFALVGVEHPQPSSAERTQLAQHFAFIGQELPPAPGRALHSIDDLPIHPDAAHIKAWVAGAGAGVALGDLDGDGLPNDMCLIDERTDSAVLEPVPGTGDRFVPVELDPPHRSVDEPVAFPTGCLIADLGERGKQDVVVYYATRPPVAFLKTDTGYVPQELVDNSDEIWATAAGLLADIDGDGHLDLMFGNYFPNGTRMYDPEDRHFVQVNDSYSHATNGGSTEILLWQGATDGPHPSVRFKRVQHVLPEDVERGWTLALAAADFTGDLLPDIYIANDFGHDRLLHNISTPGHPAFEVETGQRSFTTPKSKVLGQDSFKGMGVDVADINDDGYFDMAVSNLTSELGLEESNFIWMNTRDTSALARGIAPFTDESESLGLARSGFSWDARFGDFDNSGTQQLVQATGFIKGTTNQFPGLHESAIANESLIQFPAFWANYDGTSDVAGHEPNRFWVRGADGRYVDIAQDLHITTDEVSRGIATADVFGDGRIDMVFANQWEPSYFYRNVCQNCGNYLGLDVRFSLQPGGDAVVERGHPRQPSLSRPAVGAFARIQTPDGKSQISFVDASNGHSGKRAPELHFGLGEVPDTTPIDVAIHYRDPRGQIRDVDVTVTPGWHTILLPWSIQES